MWALLKGMLAGGGVCHQSYKKKRQTPETIRITYFYKTRFAYVLLVRDSSVRL